MVADKTHLKRYSGKVTKFFDNRGYGFIQPDSAKESDPDIFFHIHKVVKPDQTTIVSIGKGTRCTFEIFHNFKGRIAINVELYRDDEEITSDDKGGTER